MSVSAIGMSTAADAFWLTMTGGHAALGAGLPLFHTPTWEHAPVAAHVVGALAQLPVEQSLGAIMTRGSQDLLISEQRPLE